jgi:hypothetical protein
MSQLNNYSIERNMNGRQVGFCNGTTVMNYGCNESYTFDLLMGSLVADGAGHITSGTYAVTRDPNSYKCSFKNNPTSPCPVIVPSGHTYSATTAYGVGATVDVAVGTATKTYQAVKGSTGKPPSFANYVCSYNPNNLSTCLWVEIPASLTNGDNSNSSGTMTGTYTIQGSGAGVITLTPTNCDGCGTVKLQFTAAPVSVIGQSISLSGISLLGNSDTSVGSGVRVK